MQKDLVPKFLKDPTIFEQMNIRIFDGVGGPEIDPYTVDWVNTDPERYHFRQEPGEGNALATMKINFANKYMVYMHDTPHRELFEVNARFESSGCVRVDKVSDCRRLDPRRPGRDRRHRNRNDHRQPGTLRCEGD